MVKPFALSIAMWVVWHGCGLLNTIQSIQMLHNLIVKTLALVTMDLCKNTIYVKPLVHQYFCYGKCLLIWCYECLAKFGKGICQNQDVSLLLFEESTLVKSMHSRSIGLFAIIVPGFVFGSV